MVINLSPCIPVCYTDERSCYSTLLLHVPWDKEEDIVLPFDNAVAKLEDLTSRDEVPAYLIALQRQKAESEKILANQGKHEVTVANYNYLVNLL